jgi:hypothetical protein
LLQDFIYTTLHFGEFVLADCPQNFVINSKIIMDEFISKSCHLFPWDLTVFIFERGL